MESALINPADATKTLEIKSVGDATVQYHTRSLFDVSIILLLQEYPKSTLSIHPSIHPSNLMTTNNTMYSLGLLFSPFHPSSSISPPMHYNPTKRRQTHQLHRFECGRLKTKNTTRNAMLWMLLLLLLAHFDDTHVQFPAQSSPIPCPTNLM